ncbi:erythromycin esterase family protein [Pedobacter sp. SYSU D00535]|uniref:erythromycin esterase family protein n=1 Tax=Pedobacter sp. SYSU D00535 TaxID=2810308 RepID=UPI001A971854|nr:erythromycin esterase family protein [Pedobacter sp. SYSU D00535]
MRASFFVSCLLIISSLFLSCKGRTGTDELFVSIPSHPLRNANDLDSLINSIGDARVVLLGEASHGTSEFYTWRAAISKRLIQEKGFDMIGVEGEWADSYRVNQFVRGPQRDSLQTLALLQQYNRWPTWMWGNYEVASLVTWMNNWNQSKAAAEKVGFYGLDVYCIWESMEELMLYIQGNDSLMQMANEVRSCFQPYSADPGQYAYAVATASANCRAQVQKLWQAVSQLTGPGTGDTEAELVMQQNALVAVNGENYYRTSVSNSGASWNIRDRHMTATIKRLLEFHGPDSKIIVWEHNTHVGDARFTDMAAAGMVNVGQLVREEFGQDNVYIVGFGSYKGQVIAADEWGGSIETMRVPNAKRGSWEDMLHRSGAENKLLFSKELQNNPTFMKSIGHRAIGVQYDPGREAGNYVPTIVPKRYDAFIFIDESTALRPLKITPRNEPPDTYPSGY